VPASPQTDCTYKGQTVDAAENGSDLVHLGEKVQSFKHLERRSLLLDRFDEPRENDDQSDRRSRQACESAYPFIAVDMLSHAGDGGTDDEQVRLEY
jgi:hypothetical protein